MQTTSTGRSGRQVNKHDPCFCGAERWCFEVADLSGDIYLRICNNLKPEDAPDGWRYTGQSSDGRQKFVKRDYRRNRISKKYPARVELNPEPREIPQWQDIPAPPVDKVVKGSLVILKPSSAMGGVDQVYEVVDLKFQKSTGTLRAILKSTTGLATGTYEVDLASIQEIVTHDANGREQFIEYVYSETLKVVRTQWTCRRPIYPGKQTKNVRPWHLKGDIWTIGKGDIDFPLYRQDEAEAAIEAGGIIIAPGGEQAVESLRSLGLTATCNQGGEKSSRLVAQKLSPTFKSVTRLQAADTEEASVGGDPVGMANCKPLLVVWGDNDATGRDSTKELLKECRKTGIVAVEIDPVSLWADMPNKGDAKDWVDYCRSQNMTDDDILFLLKEAVEEAIDTAEEDARYRWQRQGWNAPVSTNGELGFWKEEKDGTRYFEPCCNFDFQVERELSDSEGGGLVLQVKRSFEEDQEQIILNSCDYTSPDKFSDALKKALGSGIVCNLSKFQLNALIHTRLHEYRTNRKGKKYKRIECYGQQDNGVWVFSDRQFTKDGQLTTEEQSGWVFNPKVGKEGDIIPCPQQAPINPQALKELVDVARQFFGFTNINQVLLMMGWTVAGIHSQAIFNHDSCFPLFNAHGEPGSCKTLASETCLSLIGSNWAEDGMLARASVSKVYEIGSRTGSLPFFWDDPDRSPENEEILKTWYNRKARQVRGNVQKPKSPMGVNSNHIAGGDQAATYTRIARVGFERAQGGDKGAFQALKAAQRKASGAFQLILQMGYDPDATATIETELLQHLPQAHARIAQSLAIVVHYAQKVVDITGGSEDMLAWVIQNVCLGENSADSSGDSISDFVNCLEALEAEAIVGDWNKKLIYKNNLPFVAIHHADVWALVDSRYKPATYNKKSLKTQILKAGGQEATARFAVSRDEVLAYHRMLLSWSPPDDGNEHEPPPPPRTTTRKAWLIPASFFNVPEEPHSSGGHGGCGGGNPPSGGGNPPSGGGNPPSGGGNPPTDNNPPSSGGNSALLPDVTKCDQNLVTRESLDVASTSGDENCHVTVLPEKESDQNKKNLDAPLKKEGAAKKNKSELRDENGNTVAERLQTIERQGLELVTKKSNNPVTSGNNQEEAEILDVATWLAEAIAADSREMLADIRSILPNPNLLNAAAKRLGAEGHAIIKRWVLEANSPAAADNVQNREPVPDEPVTELGGFKLGAIVALCDPYCVAYTYHGTVEGFRHQREILVRWREREGKPCPQTEWYEVKELRLIENYEPNDYGS